jgi:hypothetical protein
MWPSTMPPTVPNSVSPFDGSPSALSGASGNSAQPSAGVKRTVATAAPVDCGARLNASPPASCTVKSPAALGAAAGASAPSAPAVRNRPSFV